MEGKKSFILYTDMIHTVKKLSVGQRADLFMAILEYVNDLNPDVKDPIIDLVFEPIKFQLKRDLKKWEELKSKRSQAGKASANKRQHKSTSVNTSQQVQQVSTVNVNDTVNVNVSVINTEPLSQFFSESQQWEEATCMNALKCDLTKLRELEKNFIAISIAKGKTWACLDDARGHFVSWALNEIKKPSPKNYETTGRKFERA